MNPLLPLHHSFILCAKKFPDKTAIADRTTDRRLTYSRALTASIIFSRRIKSLPDYHIGIMVPTSAGCILAVTGTLMAGKVPVMINYSTGAENNCRYAMQKCGFKTILSSRALLQKIGCPVLPGMILLEDIMKSISIFEKLPALFMSKMSAGAILKAMPPCETGDTAVVLFTSGSEKEPKAVELSHHNIASNIASAISAFELTDADVVMSMLPLFHVFGHTIDLWMPLTSGMSVITCANPLEYKTIPKIIREEKATVIAGTPAFLGGYVRESSAGDFEFLRIIVAGADKCPDWIREEFARRHGKIVLEGYGTTETSPVISANLPNANKPGSLGKPFPGVKVKITDLVMKGYFDDLEETSIRIRDGWYDTGDMGLMDSDGFLWHKGRLKRFVKIGGEMVSLVAVEEAIMAILPSGAECCVIEIPDMAKGARIAAAITVKADEHRLKKELSHKLPRIAVPSTFIMFDELPKMGSGKIDFRAVTAMVRKSI